MIQLNDMARAALRYFDEHPQSHEWKEERKYITVTGVVPEWVERLVRGEYRMAGDAPMHKYEVRHHGQLYTTAAKSEREAVNFIRYKLYGLTPTRDLPPFSATRVCEVSATENRVPRMALTKADVAARLARMRKVG